MVAAPVAVAGAVGSLALPLAVVAAIVVVAAAVAIVVAAVAVDVAAAVYVQSTIPIEAVSEMRITPICTHLRAD